MVKNIPIHEEECITFASGLYDNPCPDEEISVQLENDFPLMVEQQVYLLG